MSYPNDNFADATEVTGASGSITPFHYDGVGDPATNEVGEYYQHAGETLWWKWTATFTGTAFFTTDGSPSDDGDSDGLDTFLQVFVTDFTNANMVAFNDDGSPNLHGGYRYNSYATCPVTTGTTYYIQVGQYSHNQAGTLHLSWGAFSTPPPPPPGVPHLTTIVNDSDPTAGPWRTGGLVSLYGTDFDQITSITWGGQVQTFYYSGGRVVFTVQAGQLSGEIVLGYDGGTIDVGHRVHVVPMHVDALSDVLVTDDSVQLYGTRWDVVEQYAVNIAGDYSPPFSQYDVEHPFGAIQGWNEGLATSEVTLDNANPAGLSWNNGTAAIRPLDLPGAVTSGVGPWQAGSGSPDIPRPVLPNPATDIPDTPVVVGWQLELRHDPTLLYDTPQVYEVHHEYGSYNLIRTLDFDAPALPSLEWKLLDVATYNADELASNFTPVSGRFTPDADQIARIAGSGYDYANGFFFKSASTCQDTGTVVASREIADTSWPTVDVGSGQVVVMLDITSRHTPDPAHTPYYGYLDPADYAADYVNSPYSASAYLGWSNSPLLYGRVRYRYTGYTTLVPMPEGVASGWSVGRTNRR